MLCLESLWLQQLCFFKIYTVVIFNKHWNSYILKIIAINCFANVGRFVGGSPRFFPLAFYHIKLQAILNCFTRIVRWKNHRLPVLLNLLPYVGLVEDWGWGRSRWSRCFLCTTCVPRWCGWHHKTYKLTKHVLWVFSFVSQ